MSDVASIVCRAIERGEPSSSESESDADDDDDDAKEVDGDEAAQEVAERGAGGGDAADDDVVEGLGVSVPATASASASIYGSKAYWDKRYGDGCTIGGTTAKGWALDINILAWDVFILLAASYDAYDAIASRNARVHNGVRGRTGCWPGRHCSPRHRMPANSRNEFPQRVSTTWRATYAFCPYPKGR